MKRSLRTGPYHLLLPLAGMLLFVLFYILAAVNYTGGSWVQPREDAFSFRYNYLCDLLDTRGINGTLNEARHWARASLGVLCAGLAYLWWQLPELFQKEGWNTVLFRAAGILAFGVTLLLSAGTHDLTLRIAGILGGVALLAFIRELFRAQYRLLGYLGILCLILFALNYAFYETGSFLSGLPLLQKVTFACFLLWFVLLNIRLFRRKRQPNREGREPARKTSNMNP